MEPNTTRIAELVRKLHAVPDKLLTAQLSLRPLSKGDSAARRGEEDRTIADACDLMHSALADVVEDARNLTQLSGIEGGAGSHRVGTDSYYREAPISGSVSALP